MSSPFNLDRENTLCQSKQLLQTYQYYRKQISEGCKFKPDQISKAKVKIWATLYYKKRWSRCRALSYHRNALDSIPIVDGNVGIYCDECVECS